MAGNQISVGNRGPAKSVDFKKALLGCVTDEKVREIETALFEKAKEGSIAAIRTWLDHCIGKPLQAIEVSGKDGTPIDINMMGEAMLAALGDDPQARLKVADAFRRLAEQVPGSGSEIRSGLSDEGSGS